MMCLPGSSIDVKLWSRIQVEKNVGIKAETAASHLLQETQVRIM